MTKAIEEMAALRNTVKSKRERATKERARS